MSRWKDNGEWSSWACATCHQVCEDPDTVTVTTCGQGHTNYLGPVYRNNRAAYKTAKERRDVLRLERHTRQMMLDAFNSAKKTKKV